MSKHDTPYISLSNVSLRFTKFKSKRAKRRESFVGSLVRRVRGLQSSSEEFWAVRNVDLRVECGERLGIIGRNGAGKSTMLRVMAGVYAPNTGCVEVCGRIAPLIDINAGFNHEISAFENIVLYGALLGHCRRDIEARIDNILKFADVEEFGAMPTKYYSTGMLKRLAFSAATEISPDVLLMDEVFSGGDAYFQEKAKVRMLDLIDTAKVMVMVSHKLKLIRELCTRVIWIDKGQIVYDGQPKEVIKAYSKMVECPEVKSRKAA